MTDHSDITSILEIARQIMTAAGCASIITIDESGLPTTRPVRAFPSDEQFSRITIPSDINSRKTKQLGGNPHVVLGYVDAPSRGYVTIIGKGELVDSPEAKHSAWQEPFAAFWPDGPESGDYILLVVNPERIEMRSYTQGVAETPTLWKPLILTRTENEGWQLDA